MAAVVGAVALMAAVAVPMATSATAAPKAKPKSVSGLYYTVTDNIALGNFGLSLGLAYSADHGGSGGTVYASQYNGNIQLIDAATKTLGTVISLPGGYQPRGVALGYDDTLYVAMPPSSGGLPNGVIGRVNLQTNTYDDSAPSRQTRPFAMAVLGDDTTGDDTVFVGDTSGGPLSILNASPYAWDDTLSVGQFSYSLALGRDDTLYVPTQNPAQLRVINSSTRAIAGTVALGGSPYGTAVTEDETIYVANTALDAVQVVNGRTLVVDDTVAVGDSPQPVAYDPVFKRLYVGNVTTASITVINTVTNAIDETIDLQGKQPQASIVVSPDGSRVFAATTTNNQDGYVTVISVSTSPPTPPTPAPVYPPGAPTEVTAVGGDRSAEVSWTAPAYVGSYPITNYQVTASPGGQTCLVAAPSLRCTVSGLTNGVTYTFRARALNGAGWGADSEPSNAVTPDVPVVPSIMITGSRNPDSPEFARVRGTTVGLVGQEVTPWIRFPGESSYTEGFARRTVAADGTFDWQRATNRKLYVYFKSGVVRSNRVIIAAP